MVASNPVAVAAWANALSKDWMEAKLAEARIVLHVPIPVNFKEMELFRYSFECFPAFDYGAFGKGGE